MVSKFDCFTWDQLQIMTYVEAHEHQNIRIGVFKCLIQILS